MQRKGHFSKVCRSRATSPAKTTTAALTTGVMTISAQSTVDPISKTSISVELNGTPVNALLGTGASNSHVNEEVTKRLSLDIAESTACIGLAVKGCCSKILGTCKATVGLQQRIYKEVPFTVLKDLLTDVVLGQDFMNQLKQLISILVAQNRPESKCFETTNNFAASKFVSVYDEEPPSYYYKIEKTLLTTASFQ